MPEYLGDIIGIRSANALNSFTSGQQNAAARAAGDNTGQIVNDAGQYVNNSQVQSALNSTNSAINQTLSEQTLPQLNNSAANNGNLNSSRAGMEAGMAREGAATAEGQADASILNNAYNTGVGAATTNYGTNLGAQIASNAAGSAAANTTSQGVGNQQIGVNEFNAGNAVSAANAGLSQGLGYQLGNANTELAGNAQLGNATGLGISGATTAGNLATQNYNLGAAAGGLEQTGAQENLTNAYDQYQEQMQQPWTTLDNYMAVQQANAGGSSTSNGTQTPASNVASQALGGAAAGNALYQQYQDYNPNPYGLTRLVNNINSGTGTPAAIQGAFGVGSNQYVP